MYQTLFYLMEIHIGRRFPGNNYVVKKRIDLFFQIHKRLTDVSFNPVARHCIANFFTH